MSLTLAIPPVVEPLTLAEVCAHLRLSEGDDDATVMGLVAAARQYLDGSAGILGRCLCPQTWQWVIDQLPVSGGLRLPLQPVQSVDAITYRDAGGSIQSLAADQWTMQGAMLYPAWGASWPRSAGAAGVMITYTAGYGGADAVPAPIKQAMLLLIGHWYDTRTAVNVGNIVTQVPFAVDALLASYRVPSF